MDINTLIPDSEISSGGAYIDTWKFGKESGKFKIKLLEGSTAGYEAWTVITKKDGGEARIPVFHTDKQWLLDNFEVAEAQDFETKKPLGKKDIKFSLLTLVAILKDNGEADVLFMPISTKTVLKSIKQYATDPEYGGDLTKMNFNFIVDRKAAGKDKYQLMYIPGSSTPEQDESIKAQITNTEGNMITIADLVANEDDAKRAAGTPTKQEQKEVGSVADSVIDEDPLKDLAF